ncbi:TPA: hypothetical protein DCZ46_01100 [Candidatus Campbellbacteria bacterium]|nr:hypothetical protein [Candidatus Campbellbacteria bacterium]
MPVVVRHISAFSDRGGNCVAGCDIYHRDRDDLAVFVITGGHQRPVLGSVPLRRNNTPPHKLGGEQGMVSRVSLKLVFRVFVNAERKPFPAKPPVGLGGSGAVHSDNPVGTGCLHSAPAKRKRNNQRYQKKTNCLFHKAPPKKIYIKKLLFPAKIIQELEPFVNPT